MAAGSFTGFLALIAAAAAALAIAPIMLRAIGSADFGLWTTLSSAASYAALADFGLGSAAAKFVGELRLRDDLQDLRDFLATAAVMYAAVFVGVVVLTLGVTLVLPWLVPLSVQQRGELLPVMVILGCSTALVVVMNVLANVLHANQQLPVANLLRGLYWLFTLAFATVAAIAHPTLLTFAISLLAAGAVACLLAFLLIRARLPELRFGHPTRQHAASTLRYSVFLFMISAGGMLVFQSDNIVIANALGVAAVTSYAVALRLTRALTAFLHKIADVLFPFYAGMWALRDVEGLRRGLLLTTRLELTGAVAVALCLGFGGLTLLRLWVGSNNVVETTVLALAIALVILEAVIHPAAILTAATGGERPMALVNNIEAALNLGLSILLVRHIGVTGAIAGTVIAQATTNLCWLPLWAVRRVGLTPAAYLRQTAVPCLLPAVIAVVAGGLVITLVQVATFGPLAAAFVAVAVYSVTYLLTSGSTEERAWLIRMGRSILRALPSQA